MNKINVLVCNIQSGRNTSYLPYIWAILKTYCDQDDILKNNVNWLDPLWLFDIPSELAKNVDWKNVDVLALSCYTWNLKLQKELARLAKRKNKNIIIIGGGPDVDYSNKNVLNIYKNFDILAIKDGEEIVRGILINMLNNNYDFSNVGNIVLLKKFGGYCTLEKPLSRTIDYKSPWLEQKDYFLKQVEKFGYGNLDVVYETNRGCPYACNFCDWGSQTASKIRPRELETISKELEFIIKEIRPRSFFLADGNFGILHRDIDISKKISGLKKETGYPLNFMYSFSKNNTDRNFKIAEILAESKAISYFNLSIQHTDPFIISVMDRQTIDNRKILDLVRKLKKIKLPITTQLILGYPGDTVKKWMRNFYILMEWGIHSDFFIYPFQILPNSPVNNENFFKKWKVKTFTKFRSHPYSEDQEKPHDYKWYAASTFVVGSKTYNTDDWVTMHVDFVKIMNLHHHGLCRALAFYARKVLNMNYEEFYTSLILYLDSNYPVWNNSLNKIRNQLISYLKNDDDIYVMKFSENFKCELEEWLLFNLLSDKENFFKHVNNWAETLNFPESLLKFQELIIIDYKQPVQHLKLENFLNWEKWFVDCFENNIEDWEYPKIDNQVDELILESKNINSKKLINSEKMLQLAISRKRGKRLRMAFNTITKC